MARLVTTVMILVSVAAAAPPAGNTVEPAGEGIMGMKVQRVETAPGRVVVTTTGARYVFDGQADRIDCFQRIGAERRVATLRLKAAAGVRVADLKPSSVRDEECVLKAGRVAAVVRNDSLLQFHGLDREALDLSCHLKSARRRDLVTRRRGRWGHDRQVSGFFDGKGGIISYGDLCGLAVMPPREFDWGAFHDLRPNQLGSELWGLKGADQVIEENRRRGVNLFIIWGGACWETAGYDARRPFVPKDEPALRRVIDKAHTLEARVMLYLTNGTLGRRGSPGDYLQRIGELVKKFSIDGVYHDGPTSGWSREQTYNFLRNQKKRFPKLLCFVHAPHDPLAEAYLDAKVVGEFDREKGRFNRDAMDSRGFSNALVFWVPDHNMGRTPDAIDTVLDHRARMYWGFLPETDLPGKPRHVRLWGDYYMARLDLMRLSRHRRAGAATAAQHAEGKEAIERRIRAFRQAEKDPATRVAAGLAGKAAASSQEGVVYYPGDYPPQHACDGSLETCWLAAADRPHRLDWHSDHAMSLASLSPERMARQWLQIDLGKPRPIARLLYDTHWPGQDARSVWQEAFRIAASEDGKTWTVLLAKAHLTEARRFDVRIEPARARYVRVDGIRSRCRRVDFWHAAYVTELQLYPPQ